jgi:hypothetical protein
METLKKNGQADDEAVSDAKTNLAMAAANLLLAELKLAAAAAKSAASASTLWTGFYGDLRLSIEGSKTNNSSSWYYRLVLVERFIFRLQIKFKLLNLMGCLL